MSADPPPALRGAKLATMRLGLDETADFTCVPTQPGEMALEVLNDGGQRVVLPVEVKTR